MGLRREDVGLGISMVAAVALIGGFLVVTGRLDDDEGPTTTVPADRVVRAESPQPPELAWSSARGRFRIHCDRGDPDGVEARISSLPATLRYAWVAAPGNGDLVPLEEVDGLEAELLKGDGEPAAFRPQDGTGTVRFTFDEARPRPADTLRLLVLGAPFFQSYVIGTPRLRC